MRGVLVLLTLCLTGSLAFAETSNRIVAIVGDEVITEADVGGQLDALLSAPPDAALSEVPTGEMQRAVLIHLIEQRLLLQEAKRIGLTVSGEELADRVEALRRRLGSEERLQQLLAEAGLSREGLKEQLTEQLLVKKVVDVAVRSKITVSPREVAEELEQHPGADEAGEQLDVSHILVRVNESRSEEEAKARIHAVAEALAAGGDFVKLAREYSEDPHAQQGGAMGWVRPGFLMPELDQGAFSLEEGAVSAPIRTPLGFHIVKVNARRTLSSLSALAAKQAVQEQLFQRKFEAALTRWLTALKRRAYIEIR